MAKVNELMRQFEKRHKQLYKNDENNGFWGGVGE